MPYNGSISIATGAKQVRAQKKEKIYEESSYYVIYTIIQFDSIDSNNSRAGNETQIIFVYLIKCLLLLTKCYLNISIIVVNAVGL